MDTIYPKLRVHIYSRIDKCILETDLQNSCLWKFAYDNDYIIAGIYIEILDCSNRHKNYFIDYTSKEFINLLSNLKKDDCILVYSKSHFFPDEEYVADIIRYIHSIGAWIHFVKDELASYSLI